MTRETQRQEGCHSPFSRRQAIGLIGTAAGAALVGARQADAQTTGQGSSPAGSSVQGNPSVRPAPTPRDYSPGATPVSYPDPDVIMIDPAFNQLRLGNTGIQRLWTGGLWCEGPAWSSQGRYLVWSDIPNNRQMRWLEDDGRVAVFRAPSNNSNGSTFDFEGRQISCEHGGRRVVRYEHDGSITVLAESFQGQRLNTPNDVAAHQDGSYWFTDPSYGFSLYEGAADAPGGPGNLEGRVRSRIGQPVGIGTTRREMTSANVYRIDPSGRIDMMITEKELGGIPNGILFSPDYKKVYIVLTEVGLMCCEINNGPKLGPPQKFGDFTIDGVRCATDGARADVYGNIWCSSNAGQNLGYSGVTVFSPEGKLLGRIRLPEACANVCFGGPKRNRLFMVASRSLYAVYVGTQGAAPG
jgi:gluconolactonase